MSDYIEYTPKRHGQRPPYWTPDTPTGLDNKNFVRQPNWAWIAGTVYYVPYEAVYGRPRPAPVDEGDLVTFEPFDERAYKLMDIRRDIDAHLSGGSRAANTDEINQIWEMLERMLRLIEKERSDDT